ncbi:MAG: glycosyltransferase family 39 protein [Tepidisphaeraceae bacterium]
MNSPVAVESKTVRWLGLVGAFVLAALFFAWTQAYFAPLHIGVDQNGYLVGGKQFARTLLPRQSPTLPGDADAFDPHAFVADMWVQAANDKENSFDPKYPVGLPIVYAILIWLTGGGTTAAYYVSPVAMALTLPATFVVVRRFAGTFGGLLAVLTLATSPLIASLVNNPNSHAITMCAATWGMAAVLRWWHDGHRRWAVVGGLLVGYAATVRYTDGLLVLPLVWATIVRTVRHDGQRWPWRKRVADALLLAAAWAVPVIALATYNLLLLGTLTGYDSTNESTGFAWSYFFDNWETALRNLGAGGIAFLLPLSIAGLAWLPFRDWRRAGFLLAWVLPSGLLYAFYYWGPDGIGYLRFFATIFPALLAAGFALVADRTPAVRWRDTPTRRPVWLVALRGVLILLAGAGMTLIALYGPRYDSAKKTLATVAEYVDRAPTAYQRAGGSVSLIAGAIAAGLIATAIAATRRQTARPLAVGLVAVASCAVSADASWAWLEQNGYQTDQWQATTSTLRRVVPDGAVLICPEVPMLQAMQFLTEDRCYTGLTFDRNWVNGRPRAAVDDPVLIDPVRGQQLFARLEKFDQKALTEQARYFLKSTLNSRRRVFVLEAVPTQQIQTFRQKMKDGHVPSFVSRYVTRAKDNSLVAKRVDWWTVPEVVKDTWPNVPRGRKTIRPDFRAKCYQLWEVTAG